MNEQEIWKPIEGWEGLYEISNLGRVRGVEKVTPFGSRTKTYHMRLLTPCVGKRGYYVVALNHNNKAKTYTLHRLIAKAFIPNPENKPCIDHIDGNKLNNKIDNLRWCTYKENSNNPITRKKMSTSTKKNWNIGLFENRNNITYRKVGQYTKNGILLMVYNSIKEASEQTNINASSITCVCTGRNPKRHTAGGFIWKHIGLRQKREENDVK